MRRKKKKRLKKIIAVGIVLTFVCGCGNGIKTTSPSASPDDKMAEFVFSEDGKKVAAVKNGDTARYAIIPDGVTSIGSEAFWNCGKITSITLPEGLKEIDDRAFSGCEDLESVTIPDGVETIGDCAFEGVPHIEYHGSAIKEPWYSMN